jgi:hypothetical protein
MPPPKSVGLGHELRAAVGVIWSCWSRDVEFLIPIPHGTGDAMELLQAGGEILQNYKNMNSTLPVFFLQLWRNGRIF